MVGLKKQQVKKTEWNHKKTLWPLFTDGVQLLKDWSHIEEAVFFIKLSPQKFLVLILLTSEGWKTESTSEPLSGFDHETPRLGIQHLTLCQKVVNTAEGIFLPGGENLRRSDFDNSKIFQS